MCGMFVFGSLMVRMETGKQEFLDALEFMMGMGELDLLGVTELGEKESVSRDG